MAETKNDKSSFEAFKENFNKLAEKLDGRLSDGWLTVFLILLSALAAINPTVSRSVANFLFNQMQKASTSLKESGSELFSRTADELTNLKNQFSDYIGRNIDTWRICVIIYYLIVLTLLPIGISDKNNWIFVPAALAFIAPIYLLGLTLSGLGKAIPDFVDSKKNVHNGLKRAGSNLELISALLLILTLAYSVFSTSTFIMDMFIIVTAILLAAAIYLNRGESLPGLIRLASLVVGSSMVFLGLTYIYATFEPVQTRIDSWTDLGKAKNELASVENVNEAQSTKMNADEAKVVPRWIATYNAKLFTEPGGKVVIDTVFINEIVRIEKSKTTTTPDGRIWVWATNEDNENCGWVNQMAFKPLTDEELRNMMSRKGL